MLWIIQKDIVVAFDSMEIEMNIEKKKNII